MKAFRTDVRVCVDGDLRSPSSTMIYSTLDGDPPTPSRRPDVSFSSG